MRPSIHARTGESGLTIVELTIAGVIGTVVLAAAFMLLSTVRDGAARVDSKATTSIALDRALDLLRQDVTAARARDRASNAVYDQLDFTTAIRTGAPLRGFDADGVTIRDLDVQDVVVATRGTFVLSSSAHDGTRCVRWHVRSGSLVREQLGGTDQGCSAGLPVTRTRTLVTPADDGRTAVVDPFSYVVASPSPSGCATTTREAVPAAARGAIVAVNVDLQALAGHRAIDAASGRMVRIDLRSRLAEEYQRALGCAR